MNPAIAFEGPDLTGKTTILDALQKRMPYAMWPVLSIHSSTQALQEPGGAAVNAAGVAFYSAVSIMTKTMPVLLDRCYVTNYVYGKVFGREPDLDLIKKVAARLRPTIVYLYTPRSLLLERLKWRGDDFVSADILTKVYGAYQDWSAENPFSDEIVTVNTVNSSIEDLVEEIVTKVTE